MSRSAGPGAPEGPPPEPHRVAVVCVDGVLAFDVAGVVETLRWARLPGGRPAYDVVTAGPAPSVRSTAVSLVVQEDLGALAGAGTVVLPGREDPAAPLDERVVAAVRAAHARGGRVVSVCVGAFDLARTGLLDGRRATTHWRAAAALAEAFPRVAVDPDALWVDEGSVLTSAGATAGIDLCLHLVERDHGAAVALEAARSAVVPLVRPGGQAQFADPVGGRATRASGSPLAPVLSWMEARAAEPIALGDIAARAHVSTRTLSRRFRAEVGTTPSAWLTSARVRLARSLLETTDEPVARIAELTGLGSATNLRARFQDALGTSPTAYRRAFRVRAAPAGERAVP